MCTLSNILKYILIFLIKGYQNLLSPILPPSCRFTPSCSEYSKQSLIKFGLLRGSYLTILRLLKCHPLGSKGYDPVPEKLIKVINGTKSKL